MSSRVVAATGTASPQMAARELFQGEQGSSLASTVIKTIVMYPPSDLVQLKSGETGVVTRRSAADHGALVATLSDHHGKRAHGTQHRDAGDPAYAIAAALADHSAFPRVLPERVYGVLPP